MQLGLGRRDAHFKKKKRRNDWFCGGNRSGPEGRALCLLISFSFKQKNTKKKKRGESKVPLGVCFRFAARAGRCFFAGTRWASGVAVTTSSYPTATTTAAASSSTFCYSGSCRRRSRCFLASRSSSGCAGRLLALRLLLLLLLGLMSIGRRPTRTQTRVRKTIRAGRRHTFYNKQGESR